MSLSLYLYLCHCLYEHTLWRALTKTLSSGKKSVFLPIPISEASSSAFFHSYPFLLSSFFIQKREIDYKETINLKQLTPWERVGITKFREVNNIRAFNVCPVLSYTYTSLSLPFFFFSLLSLYLFDNCLSLFFCPTGHQFSWGWLHCEGRSWWQTHTYSWVSNPNTIGKKLLVISVHVVSPGSMNSSFRITSHLKDWFLFSHLNREGQQKWAVTYKVARLFLGGKFHRCPLQFYSWKRNRTFWGVE